MPNKQQRIDILKSWHAIEFFQPYDLSKTKTSFQITFGELHRLKNNLLPWLSAKAKSQANIATYQKCHYTIHLAIFDKNETTQESKLHLTNAENNKISTDEIEERLKDEGQTCFAKLSLDDFGTPNFETFSISTLPWALGHLKNNTLDQLSYQKFQDSCSLLTEALNRIKIKLKAHPENNEVNTLCADSLISLINNLYKWTDFTPAKMEADPNYALAFQLTCQPLTQNPKNSQANVEDKSKTDKNLEKFGKTAETETTSEPILPILNSFFIDDIEWAINSTNNNEDNSTLSQYLSIKSQKKTDLYTQAGLKLINKNLQPNLMPLGRWPSNPEHNMALMQQFAINTTIKKLKNGGLLSVNGPPGTGKTTLLRDLIAHIITERATKLASFDSVDDSLDANGFPHDSLHGFEIVVASSNNTAVQNISKELPQIKALGDEFQDINFLKSVANQLAAKVNIKHFQQDGRLYQALKKENKCWGTIAATLGKKANREDFLARFFFKNHFKKDSEDEKNRPTEYDFLNLWRWKKLTPAVSFSEAKEKFKTQLDEIKVHIDTFDNIVKLLKQISNYRKHKKISDTIDEYTYSGPHCQDSSSYNLR